MTTFYAKLHENIEKQKFAAAVFSGGLRNVRFLDATAELASRKCRLAVGTGKLLTTERK